MWNCEWDAWVDVACTWFSARVVACVLIVASNTGFISLTLYKAVANMLAPRYGHWNGQWQLFCHHFVTFLISSLGVPGGFCLIKGRQFRYNARCCVHRTLQIGWMIDHSRGDCISQVQLIWKQHPVQQAGEPSEFAKLIEARTTFDFWYVSFHRQLTVKVNTENANRFSRMHDRSASIQRLVKIS